ncbi:MAG: PD-(D/E)XK nuclease family protein, partial [Deltaproteobacteria bacterium]|nr:PD-(D/E)XK nuclease family protein [Deltaproteobacteria bacterium]
TLNTIRQDDRIASLLASAETSYTELPFIMDCGEFFLCGTLDRLFLLRDEWIVLDYKTDRFESPEELNRRVSAYEGQMACYALAASEILNVDKLKSALLFTEGPALNEKEWGKTDLESARKELQTIHQTISGSKTDQGPGTSDHRPKASGHGSLVTSHLSFNYPEDTLVCRHCGYFEGNYCGVRGKPRFSPTAE